MGRFSKGILLFFGWLFAFQVLCFVAFVAYLYWVIPSPEELRSCQIAKMHNVRLCPGESHYVPISKISPWIRRAVVLTEDGNFFQHQGFDWEALNRSVEVNWAKGGFKQGGSTITQQLAKNLYLSGKKTLWRKFLEALITIRLEKHLTKDEILERYLNVVEFGPKIYGIKQASAFYFKKSPRDLDLFESSFLAFVLPSPTRLSRSYLNGKLSSYSERRVGKILRLVARSGEVSSEEVSRSLTRLNLLAGKSIPEPLHEEISSEEIFEDVLGEVEEDEEL